MGLIMIQNEFENPRYNENEKKINEKFKLFLKDIPTY